MAMHIRFFNALTSWITHLASRVVPSRVQDKRNGVADHSPTAGESLNDNAEDKSLKKIFIPNVLARWPWPRRLNQHYPEVGAESTAWIASFKPFSPKAQDAFDRCEFNLLGCLAYLTARKGEIVLNLKLTPYREVHTEHARAGCDHMGLIFLIDEYSDASGEDEVRKQKNIIMDALRNPHNPRPKGEWVVGEMHRQFWERTIPYATAQSQRRFIAAMDECLEGIVQQAIDRSRHLIRDIQSYHDVRSRTIGVRLAYTILELGLDIPDEIMSHSSIEDMTMASIEMIYLHNVRLRIV
ncbi:hypothetical protein AZE42_11144 [Rhizopogon vesiculosus]|uniref:Terpenoid synthase n=1 Tax=Rhizopogon vesiculosus TaxID=180088 RepID=A0A1J8PKN5_9AGAM|nr:hypothetical protein AZE42_11144 [Rhizopogon vesiculosus]